MKAVVDTNVPVVANGKSDQASPECVSACVRQIRKLTISGKLILDDQWLIIREYTAQLQSHGQPGVGDAFLKWVLSNWQNPKHCELVHITPKNSTKTDFAEFPSDLSLDGFDPADKKFVAVAAKHEEHPPIWQAVDAKWWNFRNELSDAGIAIEFLCENDIQTILKASGK